MACFESEYGNIDCDFVLEEDNKLYCRYAHKECDFEKCVFYKNGVGIDDLKGLPIGKVVFECMSERKEVVHYCVKCGKGMKYREKKMCYLYDIKPTLKFGIEIEQAKKRFAINLCEKCADELEKMIDDWRSTP